MSIHSYHSKYIVDASIIVKWFISHEEIGLEQAFALQEWHKKGKGELVIPEVTLLEVLNAICYNPKGKEEVGARAIEFLRNLDLQIEPLTWDCLRKANAIAWAYKVPLYDAAYVALAEVLGYPFLTVDEVLLKKMKGHSIVLNLKDLDFPQ